MTGVPANAALPFWPGAAELARRAPSMLLGLFGLGAGLALMVEAHLGLAPWDVLHQGLADRLDVEIGTVVIGVGLIVLLGWIPLRQRPGIGTLCNTILVGTFANLTLALLPTPGSLAVRWVYLVVGVVAEGIAVGLYIGTGLGPGPRDGLMTGIASRWGAIWSVRMSIEIVVLVIGFGLGGTVGVGTVLFAFGIGPLAHVFLRVFHRPITQPLGPGATGE